MKERLTNIGSNGEIWITDNDYTRKNGRKESAYKKLKNYEDLEEQGRLIVLPCEIGETVYKICPVCNENHQGNCKHCAWNGCQLGCDVGVKVYEDGSFTNAPLQVIPKKFTKGAFFTVLEYWNIMYFPSEEDAKTALEEYEEIRKIKESTERYKKYKEWESERAVEHYRNFQEK